MSARADADVHRISRSSIGVRIARSATYTRKTGLFSTLPERFLIAKRMDGRLVGKVSHP